MIEVKKVWDEKDRDLLWGFTSNLCGMLQEGDFWEHADSASMYCNLAGWVRNLRKSCVSIPKETMTFADLEKLFNTYTKKITGEAVLYRAVARLDNESVDDYDEIFSLRFRVLMTNYDDPNVRRSTIIVDNYNDQCCKLTSDMKEATYFLQVNSELFLNCVGIALIISVLAKAIVSSSVGVPTHKDIDPIYTVALLLLYRLVWGNPEEDLLINAAKELEENCDKRYLDALCAKVEAGSEGE